MNSVVLGNFHRDLQKGDLFSWHVIGDVAAKFAWLVMDVTQPFANFKEYEAPKEYRHAKSSIDFEGLRQAKLFRTLRTVAPNIFCDVSEPHELRKELGGSVVSGSNAEVIGMITASKRMAETFSRPSEILWLVKPNQVQHVDETMERKFVNTCLQDLLWRSLGFRSNDYYTAYSKYHIGQRDKRYTSSGSMMNDHVDILDWIRFIHHRASLRNKDVINMRETVLMGAGLLSSFQITGTGFPLHTKTMTSTEDINQVWIWR